MMTNCSTRLRWTVQNITRLRFCLTVHIDFDSEVSKCIGLTKALAILLRSMSRNRWPIFHTFARPLEKLAADQGRSEFLNHEGFWRRQKLSESNCKTLKYIVTRLALKFRSQMSMTEKPSKTADLAVAARAAHLFRDDPPIINDYLALPMCSKVWKKIIPNRFLHWLVIDKLLKDVVPITMVVYTRARFAEDEALLAVENGTDQIVILGAGYDTFAIRHPELNDKTTIFEIDQSATQQEKRSRMKNNNIPEPENVRYIAADLNQDDLFDVLTANGFETEKPALFSWFGVTYYLPFQTVESTLRKIAQNSAPNTEVLFDYVIERSCIDPEWISLHDSCAKFVSKKGEKWVSSIDPGNMAEFLDGCGYSRLKHLTTDKVNSQYFANRSDGLVYPGVIEICKAIHS